MANREENLKKINDELEKLDDEQLEDVAGGIVYLNAQSNEQAKSNAILQGGLEQHEKYGISIPQWFK